MNKIVLSHTEYCRQYYNLHKEEILTRHSEYYQKNKDKILATQAKYYEKNKIKRILAETEYQKEYNKTPQGRLLKNQNNHRMMILYPLKNKARNTLRNAVKAGKIIKQPCEVCGNPKVEAHHEDYSKPLEVKWLCHQHHCELEGRWIAK